MPTSHEMSQSDWVPANKVITKSIILSCLRSLHFDLQNCHHGAVLPVFWDQTDYVYLLARSLILCDLVLLVLPKLASVANWQPPSSHCHINRLLLGADYCTKLRAARGFNVWMAALWGCWETSWSWMCVHMQCNGKGFYCYFKKMWPLLHSAALPVEPSKQTCICLSFGVTVTVCLSF